MNTKPLLDPINRSNVGHIKAQGSQVVGPYSVHPSGKLYLIENALPFDTTVTEQRLHEVLGPFIAERTRKAFTQQKGYSDDLSFPILKIPGIKPGLQVHPIHGSKSNNKNLNVDPETGLWYCFACQSGGTGLHWLAVNERIVGCWEIGQGRLRGEAFKKAKQRAIELGLIENTAPKGSLSERILHHFGASPTPTKPGESESPERSESHTGYPLLSGPPGESTPPPPTALRSLRTLQLSGQGGRVHD